jgi:methyl-accepting chemotaxis protein-2 (aspartate sensor receptor)
MQFARSVKQRVAAASSTLRTSLVGEFVLEASQLVETNGRALPTLRCSGRILNLDFSVADGFTARTGLLMTIFVRAGDDFFRITTSVKKPDGQRAIGTPLDRSQPAYRDALAGKPYVGYATVFGRQCMTRYVPVQDAQGRIVAILFVGLDVTDLPGLSVSANIAVRLALGYGVVYGVFQALTGQIGDPWVWGFGLFSVGAIWAIAYGLLNRYVALPVVQGRLAAQRLAGGDLMNQVHVDGRDDLGQMLLAINGVSIGLTGLVGTLRTAATQVAEGNREIADANTDLAHRTEKQSGEVNATASAMEELTANVSQSAERTGQVHALVSAVSDKALSSSAIVGQLVETMGKIKASSHRINDIVALIDGIAFQTNILALNAAVEAARAGEQGRGFAVVATEVRSLAQRAAGSAREIRDLIQTSVQMTEAGSDLVDKALEAMNQIAVSVGDVVGVTDGIAVAGSEQRAAIQDVNRSVGEIEQMTQQNAALVEQSAAAAMKMRDQAGALEKAVDGFKTHS